MDRRPTPRLTPLLRVAILALAGVLAAGCDTGTPAGTPPITPGTSGTPRDVNVVARDYGYVSPVVDLVPGETVVLHLVNGGLETHEAVVGTLAQQLAWEAAETVTADRPPGPTPAISPPPGFAGTRVVAGSGQRVDVTWTVPADAASAPGGWFVGCHIPGHWQKGRVVPVRLVDAGGRVIEQPLPLPSTGAG